MNSNPVGITFMEMMSGGFSMGETDTATGQAMGDKNILVMHGTITIDDIDRFIADPGHLGRLDVIMDWPPFGTGLPAPGGVFNLFSPSGDPALKLMVYEWGLQHEGKDYYFAGQKNVQVHPVLEIWNDTTTLHTQLHQGKDKSGPVVGAGIISLKFEELLKMAQHFKPLNAPSVEAGAAAIAKFGKFFMGQLWETYIARAGA
jgi:cholesterol oxidase